MSTPKPRRARRTTASGEVTLHVVSDGRGETAEQMVRAASLQFEGARYRIVRHAQVRTPERVREIVERAAAEGAPVFYTLVGDETRRAMRRTVSSLQATGIDLLGATFRALHDAFNRARTARPGLLYAADRERIDRMQAIDYTLKHDDGQRPAELAQADVVLVGVSRACKSSTCFYLAYEGVRAANVPLIPGVPIPASLTRVPRESVIGLRINLDRLLTVRHARAHHLRLGRDDDYVDKRWIAREILEANRIMDRHGWDSIDVSYLAIEEIAREVLRIRGRLSTSSW